MYQKYQKYQKFQTFSFFSIEIMIENMSTQLTRSNSTSRRWEAPMISMDCMYCINSWTNKNGSKILRNRLCSTLYRQNSCSCIFLVYSSLPSFHFLTSCIILYSFCKTLCINIFTYFCFTYSETLNKEYIERIHQMSYSSLSDKGMLQIFSFLIK